MLPAGITFRRATLDDLESLRGLWMECRLPEYELEKRFTEFQVAVDAHGWILGALGLRFSGPHGHVHSLSIRRADLQEDLTRSLWDRQLALAHQQGAHRLWTREAGPFWPAQGFGPAEPRDLQEFPVALGNSEERWLVRKLREDPLKLIAAEEQLEAYLEMERLRTEQLVRRGQFLKMAATAFAAVLFGLALVALFLVLRRKPGTPRR